MCMKTTLLTMYHLSEITGLPVGWLKREADGGRLPCIRVGGQRRRMFNLDLVMKTLNEQASRPAQRLQDQIQALQDEVRESRARIGEPQVLTHSHGNGCSAKACGCRLLAARERVDALEALGGGE